MFQAIAVRPGVREQFKVGEVEGGLWTSPSLPVGMWRWGGQAPPGLGMHKGLTPILTAVLPPSHPPQERSGAD